MKVDCSKITSSDHVWSWILDNVHTLDATGGVKPFPDFPFVKWMIEAMVRNRILILCKSRQMIATWSVCAWMLYRGLYDSPGLFMLMSKGERDSRELVKRFRVMVNGLPDEIKSEVSVKTREITFGSGSRIISLPATEEAPRMHSPSGVFWDEMAFTPYSEGIWTAVKPAIDSGGSFIGVSTPNGTDNVFYHLYQDKSNRFGRLKVHWKDHPLRGEEWLKEAQRGLSTARWKQEYELDFGALADRVFDEFDPETHILDKPFRWTRETGKTFRGIDFGYRHPYVVWLHVTPDAEMTLFDEWEGCDATVEEMAQAIRKIDARHTITENDVTWSGCDPAGAAASDSGVSAAERLTRLGFKLVWRSSEVMTGVELVKSLLLDATGLIRLRFSPDVKKTLYHLQHYRWEAGRDKPVKDNFHDHAMDALRYLIVNMSGKRPVNWSGARVAGVRW